MNDMGESVELADRMLAQVYALLRERNIIPNAVQEQMLTSHVRACRINGACPRRGRRVWQSS